MTRLILCLGLLCAGAARAQTIPSALAVPAGNKLILHAYAKGVQVYVCTQDPKDTTHYVWTFTEPQATLYADRDYKTDIGKHYLGATGQPTWESTDGSKVSAVKVQQVPDAASIPWLLLKAASTGGSGALSATTYVQRLRTTGGEPAEADARHKGEKIRVPYTAEYLFYGPQ
ncbi:DUF3455 domain-containing protein [Dinghuibacter silviterrae]|uniref:Uncharacterized protein DUF3455 n=1 Tax=Dinghuibacter silviterrae TaxID=1539049 RepID=A0A4R8DR26_9BACT|nr:DUF3455 domain-containing protein [Dinghuibacter silviterrae]TDX00622.1 uncharacterized protein DUF3455 [Dinghuibacter silviterrae]